MVHDFLKLDLYTLHVLVCTYVGIYAKVNLKISSSGQLGTCFKLFYLSFFLYYKILLQLVRLPKRETVSDVLKKYSDHVTKTDQDKAL